MLAATLHCFGMALLGNCIAFAWHCCPPLLTWRPMCRIEAAACRLRTAQRQ